MTDALLDRNTPVPLQHYAPAHPHLGELNDAIPRVGVLHIGCWLARELSTLPPAAHTIGAFLPVIAYEAARRGFTYGWRHGRHARPSLQVALVAASGSGKSTSMNIASEFHRAFLQRDLGTLYGPGAQFDNPWVMAEGSIPGITERLGDFYREDLATTPAILYTEEFTRLLESKDTVSETLNQLFDGLTFERNLRAYREAARANQKVNSSVKAPALSALFATTFSGLETATTKRQASGGFYSRMLWFTGKPGWLCAQDRDYSSTYTAALEHWTGWSGHLHGRALVDGTVLRHDPACKRFFEEMRSEVNAQIAADEHEELLPTRIRGVNAAESIAGLYAFQRGDLIATVDDAERAVRLVRATVGMAEALAAHWNTGAARSHEQRVLGALEQAGAAGLGRSELYKVVRVKAELDLVLERLVEQDAITELKVRHESGPGRPRTVYRLAAITPTKADTAPTTRKPN